MSEPKPPAAAATAHGDVVRVGKPEASAHERALKRGEASANAKLTDEQVLEIRRRHAAGEGPKALAQAFGLSPGNVRSIVARETWAHVGGAVPRRQKPKAVELSDDDVIEIRRRAATGETPKDLADLFRVTVRYMRRIIRGADRGDVVDPLTVKPPPKHERLTASEVVEIRNRHAAGETIRALAEAYGKNPNSVSAIVRGKAWKGVGDSAAEVDASPPTTVEGAKARGYTLREWLEVAPRRQRA